MPDWQFWAISGWAFALLLRTHVIEERIKKLEKRLRDKPERKPEHLKKPFEGGLEQTPGK